MFDARLILAGQAPDPLGAARTIGELLQQRQAMQDRQQTLADLLQQRAQEGALRDIYAQHADSPEGLGAALMRGGFGQQALGVEEHRAGVAAKEAAAAEQQSKLRELATKILRNRVAAVKTPEHYSALATSLPPGTLSAFGLPEEYDPAAVETFVAAGIPVEKRAELDARATEAKTRREFEAKEKALDRANSARNASVIAGGRAAARQSEGKALPPSILAELADYDTAQAQVDALFEKAENEKISGFGARLNQMATDALGLQSTDAARFEGASAPVRQGVGTILEGGKLAAGDEGKYKNMLPRYGDSKPVLAEKKKALKKYLATRKAERLKALKGGGYAAPSANEAPRAPGSFDAGGSSKAPGPEWEARTIKGQPVWFNPKTNEVEDR